MQKIWPHILVGMIRGKVCVIFQIDDESQTSFHAEIERIHHIFQSIIGDEKTVYLGVGEVAQGIKGIQKSFYQAEQAIKLIHIKKMLGPIIYFEKLGTYRLLEPLIGTRVLADFYKSSIKKLVDNDHKGDLIETLKMYFDENEVLNVSADKLYIHVNTLKYRIKKIEEITGLDLRQSEDKLTLFLGLKIHELTS